MCCDGGKGGGVCVGMKKAGFEPPLLVADAVVQEAVDPTLWTFSMQPVACGALLFSAWLEALFQPHHCRIKDWRYSQAVQVCDVLLRGVAI